jgi:phospholipid/cholesterol/gamma-HCH transport system permease protein
VSDADLTELIPESFGDRIGRVAAALSRFSWSASLVEGELRIALAGTITLDEAPALWKQVAEVLDRVRRFERVLVDLSRVDLIDGACIALLVHMRTELRHRRVPCELREASREVTRLVTLYGRRRVKRRPPRPARNALDQLGEGTATFFRGVLGVLDFFGEVLRAGTQALFHPRSLNLRDVTLTMERAGADAVPIVLLINFLIGFVMAFQSAVQLKQFGANIFVADLVGLAMVRELGPLMTAIIVSGRSGAAFAAELGTMKVSEEVDALRTLGLVPLRYLVLPRVCGLVLVAPLLTLLADIVGILGGMTVAATTLDVTPAAFMSQLTEAMHPWDVFSGLLKSMAFGAAIALIACQQGLATTGGAEGVGRRTTAAVVSILFALILLDAMFTVLLGALGA